jgi:PAS domain S-box-containing protein
MEPKIVNKERTLLLKNLINFCSENIHSKYKNEIIQEALSVFNGLQSYESSSLFLLDTSTADFIYDSSDGNISTEEAERRFTNLVEKDAVSSAINEGFFHTYCDTENVHALIFPLIDNADVIGMMILYIKENLFDTTETQKAIKAYSNSLALRLSNTQLIIEMAEIKSVYVNKFADYTEDIAQSTKDLKNLLDTIQTAIIIFDKYSGEIVEANIAAQDLIGLSKESIIGVPRNDYFVFSEYKSSELKVNNTGEKFLKKSDGSIMLVMSWMSEIFLNKEKFIVESFIDITEQKNMENELLKAHDELEVRVVERTKELSETNIELQSQIKERVKAEEEKLKLYHAVHQSPALIIITNLDGAIEYVNPIFTQITGYSFEEVKGENPRKLKSGDIKNEDYAKLWETIKKGEFWSGEFRNKKKNGDLFWVSSIVSPIRNTHGVITNYLAIQQDISEKKLAEQKLIEAKERAEESDKLKSNLLANMSHEFRTPMIGIIGFTHILEDEIENDDQRVILEQINQCSDRLLTTLNNVLSLSQLQSVDINLTLHKIKLESILEGIIQKYRLPAQQKGLEFEYNKQDASYEVFIETQLCTQLFSNIIDNAVKFTKSGSVSVSVTKQNYEEENYASIVVKDTGIGISEQKRRFLFEPFRQESEGYSRSFEGLGLGLALSKQIVDLMHGKIFFESNYPSGSIFKVLLPLTSR